MKAIVVDLELTQNKDSTPKIIQIGAVLVDLRSNRILGVFNKICNPGELPNQFITNLTGITAEQVSSGTPLNEALDLFWRWVEQGKCKNLLIDWGGGDIACLKKSSEQLSVALPEKRVKHIDLKLYASLIRLSKTQKIRGGLKNTLNLFGHDFYPDESYQHDALYDALNTAFLLFHFLTMFQIQNLIAKTYNNNLNVLNLDLAKKTFEEIKNEKN